jgi:hypothetical protein
MVNLLVPLQVCLSQNFNCDMKKHCLKKIRFATTCEYLSFMTIIGYFLHLLRLTITLELNCD